MVDDLAQVPLAEEMAEHLLMEFDLKPENLVKGAYLDLIPGIKRKNSNESMSMTYWN